MKTFSILAVQHEIINILTENVQYVIINLNKFNIMMEEIL